MRNGSHDEDRTPVATKSGSEEVAAIVALLDELASVEKEPRPLTEHLAAFGPAARRDFLEQLIKALGDVGEAGHNARRAIWNRLHRGK
jgi:hypothetical protein